jgi:large subunit ribosomal protein L29
MAKKEQAKTKAEDLKGKSPDELKAMLLDLRKRQMDMRFQRAGGQLENTSEIRKVRRTIARVKTFLMEKSAGSAA